MRITMGRLVAMVCGASAGLSPVRASDDDACPDTSESALASCRLDARATHWLEAGKCENLADRKERRACKQEARESRAEAIETCPDQFDAREDLCEVLGGEAYDPTIDPSNFVSGVDNPYFPLIPGMTYVYEQHDEKGTERQEMTVTHQTRVIQGVTCVQIRDVVALNGQVIEDTLDWYAQDMDGNVWYFGEIAMNFEDGWLDNIDGSWVAGVNRAKAGVIMKAHPQSGDLYRQEFDLGNAEDVGLVLSLEEAVSVPYGDFESCLQTEDWTPIEPDAREHKFYTPGVGQVLTVNLETGTRLELIDIRHD
ncbi:MAG: hypothetical protein FLDDKLPJ_01991 [Phycisphaerae bacterium]|nr:hypothetical protein [Phycisphaerae bacterium]